MSRKTSAGAGLLLSAGLKLSPGLLLSTGLLLGAGLLLSAGLLLGAGPVAAETTLKISSFAPPRSHNVSMVFKPWMPEVEQDAGGDLKLQGYWSGALGRGAAKQLKLLQDGIADIAFIAPSYTRGRFPDVTIFSLPYIINNAEEASVAYWRLYEKELLRGFDGIKVLALHTTSVSMVNTLAPITDIAQLKGMKMLATGQSRVRLLQMIGAVPVGIPVTKAAESLSRGVIQGALLDYTAIRSFRVQDVAFHHFNLNVGATSLAILMNKNAYDKLTPRAKTAIDKHSGEVLSRIAGAGFQKLADDNEARLKNGGKHKIVAPTKEQDAAWAKQFQPLHDDWKAKSPHDKKVYETLQTILADIRAGK